MKVYCEITNNVPYVGQGDVYIVKKNTIGGTTYHDKIQDNDGAISTWSSNQMKDHHNTDEQDEYDDESDSGDEQ